MCSTLTMKVQDSGAALRRFCDSWSRQCPVMMFDDGAAVIDFGSGFQLHMEPAPSSLTVTLLCEHGAQACYEPKTLRCERATLPPEFSLSRIPLVAVAML